MYFNSETNQSSVQELHLNEPEREEAVSKLTVDFKRVLYYGGLWVFDGTYGGNATNRGLNPNNYSDSHSTYNTYGFGVSVGTPFGFTRNKGYTWTTPTFGW